MTNKNNLIVCRCEEVTHGQLQSTIAEYNCSARELNEEHVLAWDFAVVAHAE